MTALRARRRHAVGANALGEHRGSIHLVGAAVRGAPACNGWTFWHLERQGTQLPVDICDSRSRQACNRAHFHAVFSSYRSCVAESNSRYSGLTSFRTNSPKWGHDKARPLYSFQAGFLTARAA